MLASLLLIIPAVLIFTYRLEAYNRYSNKILADFLMEVISRKREAEELKRTKEKKSAETVESLPDHEYAP